MNNKVKTEIDKLEIPDELDKRIQLGAEIANREMETNKKVPTLRKKMITKRKTVYIVSAAVILLFLFNSFINSKAVLAYIAEIPAVSKVFNLSPLTDAIYKDLQENNYDVEHIDVSISFFTGKEITIALGAPLDRKTIESEIKQTVEQLLKRENYDTFQVHITKQNEPFIYQLTSEQQKEKDRMENELKALLANLNIAYEYMDVDPLDKRIFIQVSTSLNGKEALKEHVQSVKSLLEDQTNFGTYAFDTAAAGPEVVVGENYTLSPTTDLQKNMTKLAQELTEKKEYKVTGFSYMEKPLTFEINTSVSSTDQEHGKYLETIIHTYFQSPDVASSLNGAAYEVIIYSKDQKQIN